MMKFKKFLGIITVLCLSVCFCMMAACGTKDAPNGSEFRGHVEPEIGDTGYRVTEDVTWEEDGQLCGLQEGDVIGINGDEDDYVDVLGLFRVKKFK